MKRKPDGQQDYHQIRPSISVAKGGRVIRGFTPHAAKPALDREADGWNCPTAVLELFHHQRCGVFAACKLCWYPRRWV